MDYVISLTKCNSVFDLIGMNCACYLLLSDLTIKTTTHRRQTFPHISYINIHTPCYIKITYIPLTKKIHKSNTNISTETQPLRRLCGYRNIAIKVSYIKQMTLDGAFVRANIYILYLLHLDARNHFINYISNIIIINYYQQYDRQKIISVIII